MAKIKDDLLEKQYEQNRAITDEEDYWLTQDKRQEEAEQAMRANYDEED